MPATGPAPDEPSAPVVRAGGAVWPARVVEILAAVAWLSLTADALWLGTLLQDWAPSLTVLLAATLLVGCRRRQRSVAAAPRVTGSGAAAVTSAASPACSVRPVALPALLLISGLVVLAWPAWRSQAWASPPPADATGIRVQWQPLPAKPATIDETVDVQVFTGSFAVDTLPVAAHLRKAARIHHGTWDLPAVSIRSRLPLGDWELIDLDESKARIHCGSWLAGDEAVRLYLVRQQPGAGPATWRSRIALVGRLTEELQRPGPVVLYWTGGLAARGSQWRCLQAAGLQAIAGLDEPLGWRQPRRHWAVRGLAVSATAAGSAWLLHMHRQRGDGKEGAQ